MRNSSVDAGTPKRRAAPFSPEIRPRQINNASSIACAFRIRQRADEAMGLRTSIEPIPGADAKHSPARKNNGALDRVLEFSYVTSANHAIAGCEGCFLQSVRSGG